MASFEFFFIKPQECLCFTDSIGLHRVENVSHTECAVSLHLYSPPFQCCQTFDQRTGHKNTVKMTFWSKFGKKTPIVSFNVLKFEYFEYPHPYKNTQSLAWDS